MKRSRRVALSVYGTTRKQALTGLMRVIDRLFPAGTAIQGIAELNIRKKEANTWEAYADVGIPIKNKNGWDRLDCEEWVEIVGKLRGNRAFCTKVADQYAVLKYETWHKYITRQTRLANSAFYSNLAEVTLHFNLA